MTDDATEAGPRHLYAGALTIRHSAFYQDWARQFLQAARSIPARPDEFSPVRYFLACRSIELALKAFLLAKGYPKADLKPPKIGHNLEQALKAAHEKQLGESVKLTDDDTHLIRTANKLYNQKGFEYFESLESFAIEVSRQRRRQRPPDIDALVQVAQTLVTGVKRVCDAQASGEMRDV